MKRFLLLWFLLWPLCVYAQQGGQTSNVPPFTGSGAPSGNCGVGQLYVNTATGDLYDCNLGNWNKVNGGGGGTNFGASTVIVNGGAQGLGGTSGFGTTASTLYFVTANDTETAALTISANFVTVQCAPGVSIQFTGATGGFVVTGNNDTIEAPCVLDHNAQSGSGTGPLIKASGNDGLFQGLVLQNTGVTNPASSTIVIAGGSRNKTIGNTFAGTQADSCIGLVPTAEVFDALVQDNLVPAFNPGSAGLYCLFDSFSSNAAATSLVRAALIHNTVIGHASNGGLLYHQDGNVSPVGTSLGSVLSKNVLTTNGSTNFMMKVFGFRSGTVDSNVLTDGGNAISNPLLDMGDTYDSAIFGNSLNQTSALEGGIYCVDCSRDAFTGNPIIGIGNNNVGLFIGTAANPSTQDALVGNSVTLAGSATCCEIQANGTSDPASDNATTGNTCTGTSASSQFCWQVVDTSGGTASNSSNGDTCAKVTNGFVVGSGATGTRIINPTFDTVTAANEYALSASTTVVDMNGVLFANIPSNLANGSMLYVSDDTIANPCAGSGTGAILKQLNAVHVCN